MVTVGFIVEGDTEKILIESKQFRGWCNRIGIRVLRPVINAKGGGNLLPKYLDNYIICLSSKETPDKIVVLTDLEEEPSVELVQRRVLASHVCERIDVVFVAVKSLEAWFLADDLAMTRWLGLSKRFHEANPEQTPKTPWDRLRTIAKSLGKRGPGHKLRFVRRMLRFGFSIEEAARHPNCASVRHFCEMLQEWGEKR